MVPDIRVKLIEAFSRPVIPELVQERYISLRQAIFVRYPFSQGALPEAMAHLSTFEGCGAESGPQWEITFDSMGKHVADPRFSKIVQDFTGYRSWEIVASGRAPLLSVVERVCQPDSWWSQPLNPIDPKLYAWARELCQEFDLEYIDAAELMAWKVDPDILTEEMLFRMDYTDDPNAFQLLFHE
jgi:hypothetical protein